MADVESQGCCISRSSGPNSPYPGGIPPSSAPNSARAINSPSQPNPHASPNNVQASSEATDRRQRAPLAHHINKPLRRHEWVATGKIWTAAQLDRERHEFFDTRVTGRQEIWQTIRAALEVLWEAERAVRSSTTAAGARAADEEGIRQDTTTGNIAEDRTVALATAQSILSAAEVTLPTGDLAQGAYDSMGNYYPVPEAIVADPANMSTSEEAHSNTEAKDAALGDTKAALAGTDDDTAEEGDAEERREEKGKAVLNKENLVKIRARLSENGSDVVIGCDRTETVRSIARRVAEEANVSVCMG
jgi:hypothetical protein